MQYEEQAVEALKAGTEEMTQRGAAYATLALAQQVSMLRDSLGYVVRALNAKD